jgi:hypothetical protein
MRDATVQEQVLDRADVTDDEVEVRCGAGEKTRGYPLGDGNRTGATRGRACK